MKLNKFDISRGPAGEDDTEEGYWVQVNVTCETLEEAQNVLPTVLGQTSTPATQKPKTPVKTAATVETKEVPAKKEPVKEEEDVEAALKELDKPKKKRRRKAKVDPEAAKVSETVIADEPAEPAEPAGAGPLREEEPELQEVPAELATAGSFRQVMRWMLDPEGGAFTAKQQDMIVEKCQAFREGCPALANLSGDIATRVGRALIVLTAEAA